MKKYTCECGKMFDNPQKFNGHKSHCKIHLKVTNKYDKYVETKQKNIIKTQKTLKERCLKNKQIKLEVWISEQHKCEHCGKIMTEKFGSGRFCCRSCANSHVVTQKQKDKTSKTLKDRNLHKLNLQKYSENPKYCVICGKKLSWKKRFNKVCCKRCQNIYSSKHMLELCSKKQTNLCGKGLRGWYKGFYCQSSWELAFVIYCLDFNINIIRNKEYFKYVFDNNIRTYFPDFYNVDTDTYIEIKGYYDQKSKEKINQFPKDKNIKVYCKEEMKPILQYVVNKYSKNYVDLYEKIV